MLLVCGPQFEEHILWPGLGEVLGVSNHLRVLTMKLVALRGTGKAAWAGRGQESIRHHASGEWQKDTRVPHSVRTRSYRCASQRASPPPPSQQQHKRHLGMGWKHTFLGPISDVDSHIRLLAQPGPCFSLCMPLPLLALCLSHTRINKIFK